MEKNNLAQIWEIIKDLVLPNIGSVVFNTFLFSILGLAFAIIFLVILIKKKFLERQNKYYHIGVRVIYISVLLILTLNCWAQIGLGRGVYKVLKNENKLIVNSIYDVTISQFFDSEESKIAFLQQVRNSVSNSTDVTETLNNYLKSTNSEIDIVEKTKSKFISYLTKKYEKQIYGSILYGLFYAADRKFVDDIQISDIEQLTDKLMTVDYTKIESSMKFAMSEKINDLFYMLFSEFAKSNLMFWLLCLLIPFFEFFIYKFFIFDKNKV